MLRDKNLVPLSRQHQHALALCVRIDRAKKNGVLHAEAWQAEVALIFEQEIRYHFEAEEKDVFPRCAKFEELHGLVNELLAEHAELRQFFARAKESTLDAASLTALGEKLSAHIRKEERQLFERLQKLVGAEELAAMGVEIEKDLEQASQACALPREEEGKARF
jgi:hemerythrin-like domain-containing protein